MHRATTANTLCEGEDLPPATCAPCSLHLMTGQIKCPVQEESGLLGAEVKGTNPELMHAIHLLPFNDKEQVLLKLTGCSIMFIVHEGDHHPSHFGECSLKGHLSDPSGSSPGEGRSAALHLARKLDLFHLLPLSSVVQWLYGVSDRPNTQVLRSRDGTVVTSQQYRSGTKLIPH